MNLSICRVHRAIVRRGRGWIFENYVRRNLSDHRLISVGPIRNVPKIVWVEVYEYNKVWIIISVFFNFYSSKFAVLYIFKVYPEFDLFLLSQSVSPLAYPPHILLMLLQLPPRYCCLLKSPEDFKTSYAWILLAFILI